MSETATELTSGRLGETLTNQKEKDSKAIQRWAKDTNRQFTEAGNLLVNKMICSKFLVHQKKMQEMEEMPQTLQNA